MCTIKYALRSTLPYGHVEKVVEEFIYEIIYQTIHPKVKGYERVFKPLDSVHSLSLGM